ncbi:protein FATTY ACID EXPORT 2, chloroplastic-like isoform X2 [Vitis riparia]|uniref:protein FATTY ACID EXPORT 2, chloroplastic-like isoform X2 n=1 Tax=Vitis riparia TaxID=96939 RepID=UPI00155AF24F|nr:protein FATTY ACID EXPORT 2, chloroplastic-like isoform X2 [Vitis riparia]
MAESVAISQSSLVLPHFGGPRALTGWRQSWIRFRASSPVISHKSIAGLRQTTVSSGIIATAVSDSKAPAFIVESAGEEIDVQPDTTDRAGSGSEGGNGGGGGGDHDKDDNKGEGGSDESNNKIAMSMSQKLTLGYAALVGVGGVMGYMKSGSQKSLAAGGLSALLLYYVYTQLPTRPAFASFLGLGLSAALVGVMGSRFKKSGKLFPAGVVSLVSLVMTGGYLHGILRSLH